MNKSYFPQQDAALLVWATNYLEKIPTFATELGMTPAEVDAEVTICRSIINSINLVNTQKNLLKGAVDSRDTIIATQGGVLRLDIARHKMAKDYTEAIGQDLGIIGTSTEFDPATYKAEIFTELFGGNIRIRFKKLGVDGINIYKRQKGNPAWVLLTRATKSPYDFHPVLTEANKPEHWEFRAFGVINDIEIGLASDIAEIVYGE